MAWSLKTFLGLSTDASAANLNQLRTNLNDHLRAHAHTGAAGDGSASLFVNSDYIQIVPWFPYANVNWATITGATCQFWHYLATDTTVQNNAVTFKVAPRSGTWRFDLLYRKASDYGIATVTLNGVSLGTVDFYAAVASVNNESSITGITVANTPVNAPFDLTLTMATKNAGASAYGAGVQFICLRRTGA